MNTLDHLSHLVANVTKPGGPRLYRDLYAMSPESGALQIDDWQTWQALPFLTKSYLQDIPIELRVFTEWGDINSIHASSGTSGKPPHFSPWIRLDGYEYRARFHTFTRPALCSMPIHHQHELFLDSYGVQPKLIVFDPRRARASVELARLARVDSLFIFTGHLTLIAREMERLQMGASIRFIEIAGESCSRALYAYAKRIFPNATIVSFYGATEVENPPITYPCHPLSEAEPLELHHPREGYYLELIDVDTRALVPIEAGAEGEIVLTASTSRSHAAVSPLIRYRTGDVARVHETMCKEHGTWSFVMPGRAAMDFIKIPGGILRADEVERALGTYGAGVSDMFELHFREVEDGDTVKIAVMLYIEAAPDADYVQIARDIEKRIRVAPSFTYGDGVEKGMYMPIVCAPYRHVVSGKRKRMIRD